MDIDKVLTEFHSKRDYTYYSNFFLKNTKELRILINRSLDIQDSRIPEWGAWLCNHIADRYMEVFKPKVKSIIECISISNTDCDFKSA
ncbi:MAG: hypothetical protein ACI9XP_001422 [Lentimonas sp.]|jgi:hypothetical protein